MVTLEVLRGGEKHDVTFDLAAHPERPGQGRLGVEGAQGLNIVPVKPLSDMIDWLKANPK